MSNPKHIGLIARIYGDQTALPRQQVMYEIGLTFPPGQAVRASTKRIRTAQESWRRKHPLAPAYRPAPSRRGDPVETGRTRLARSVIEGYTSNGYLDESIVGGVQVLTLTDKFRLWAEKEGP